MVFAGGGFLSQLAAGIGTVVGGDAILSEMKEDDGTQGASAQAGAQTDPYGGESMGYASGAGMVAGSDMYTDAYAPGGYSDVGATAGDPYMSGMTDYGSMGLEAGFEQPYGGMMGGDDFGFAQGYGEDESFTAMGGFDVGAEDAEMQGGFGTGVQDDEMEGEFGEKQLAQLEEEEGSLPGEEPGEEGDLLGDAFSDVGDVASELGDFDLFGAVGEIGEGIGDFFGNIF
ncbi:hypothetical protein [Gloeobacter violaceus]|uniref:Glr0201 protein n=1 Tax=Gloeobacter violaceus (strain ATCC 29082 / PCC 7421) TaxID=251221 RepID=Q7NP56_GLOVI|nr:hypothetical protein [Gloeobacter violaceus]BAC88142.1 glr0201 [Gloeobacter violaceus PCC 7421]